MGFNLKLLFNFNPFSPNDFSRTLGQSPFFPLYTQGSTKITIQMCRNMINILQVA